MRCRLTCAAAQCTTPGRPDWAIGCY
jgi:hypothetical protein